MKSGGPLKRRKGINRVSPRRIAYEDELAEVAVLVHARSGGLCEAKLDGCTGQAAKTPHHRLRRSQGGQNTLAQLLDCCPPCHTRIHANPQRSYELGLLLRRGDVA